jgi:hypothetical protein
MKIHLQEQELKTAIEEYISNQGIDLSQREIDIQLTAGRGTRGHYADIEIVEHQENLAEDPFFEDDAPETETPESEKPDPEESAINFDD